MNTAQVVEVAERAGRFALWLAIASAFVLVPYGMAARYAEERKALADAAREEKRAQMDAKAAEEAVKPQRVKIAALGMYLVGLDDAQGYAWVSNVSPRGAIVCVQGVATKAESGKSIRSLPGCLELEPYSTAVPLKLQFPARQLYEVCPKGDCQLAVVDVDDRGTGTD